MPEIPLACLPKIQPKQLPRLQAVLLVAETLELPGSDTSAPSSPTLTPSAPRLASSRTAQNRSSPLETSLLLRRPRRLSGTLPNRSPNTNSQSTNNPANYTNYGSSYGLPLPPSSPRTTSQYDTVEPLAPPRPSKMQKLLPILEWIPSYRSSDFLGDVIAGISLASFQIPLSLSYATSLAHVPTVCGLYALVVPPIVYCLFGTVPQMIVGPEGAILLVVGQAVEPILKHHALDGADLVVVVLAVAGGALFFAGLLRFGYLESVLNGALLSGFISAVGLVMVISGAIDELGLLEAYSKLPGHEHLPLSKFCFLVSSFKQAHIPTVLVSVVTFLAIFLVRRLKRRLRSKKYRWFSVFFPEILVTVVLTILASWHFDFAGSGIYVLGPVAAEGLRWRDPVETATRLYPRDFFRILTGAGFATAVLGFFESTTASKALGAQLDLAVDPDRELIALGLANLAVCTVGGLPSFGGYGRSKVNALSGAKTPMSGAVMGVFTLFVTIFMLPLVTYLPKCLLSVISSVIGILLLEETPKNIRFHWRSRGYEELATFCITVLATLFLSVELGIGVGCGYSLLRVIKHSGQLRIGLRTAANGKVLVVHIPEPLTFSNAEDLRTRLVRAGPVPVIAIDVSGTSLIDSSAAQILDQVVHRYRQRGTEVWFCGVKSDPMVERRLEAVEGARWAGLVEEVLGEVNGAELGDDISILSRGYLDFR